MDYKETILLIKSKISEIISSSDYSVFIKNYPFLKNKTIIDQILYSSDLQLMEYDDLLRIKKELKNIYKNCRVSENGTMFFNQFRSNDASDHIDTFFVDNGDLESFKNEVSQIEFFLSKINPKLLNKKLNIALHNNSLSGYIKGSATIILRINNNSENFQSEFAHEVGHYLEDVNAEISKKSFEFLNKRSFKNDPINLLSLIEENNKSNYLEDCWIMEGSFIDLYQGKIYEDSSTEILSVGLQSLFLNPKMLLFRDVELFEISVGVLNNGD